MIEQIPNSIPLDLIPDPVNLQSVNDSQRVRAFRDADLKSIDRVNPLWYASLNNEQQTELQIYRQALLDIPQQPGFPTSVVWPTKPLWL